MNFTENGFCHPELGYRMNGDQDKLTCGGLYHTDDKLFHDHVMPTMPIPVMVEWQAILVVNDCDNCVTSFHY